MLKWIELNRGSTPTPTSFAVIAKRWRRWSKRLRGEIERAAPGRSGVCARASRRARQVARARSRQETARPRQSVPRAVAAGRVQYVRRRLAVGEHRHRHRPNPRARGGDRRQRRDGQRRHVFSDDGEEASARAANRDRKYAAVRLPGRFGRRVSADAVRDFSRRASLRAHLLQPGADVGEGHRAGRGGDGQLHGGRRVRARDVRREHHRARGGHDLPGGTAAGARRDRRGGHGRGAGRRRRAYAAVGRERSPGRRRRACARRLRAPIFENLGPRAGCRRSSRTRPRIRTTIPPSCTASSRPIRASRTTCAR